MAIYIKDIHLQSVYVQLFQVANSVQQISQTLHGLSTVYITWAYGYLIDNDIIECIPDDTSDGVSENIDDGINSDSDYVPDLPIKSKKITTGFEIKTLKLTKYPRRTSRRNKVISTKIVIEKRVKKRNANQKLDVKHEQISQQDNGQFIQFCEESLQSTNSNQKNQTTIDNKNGLFQCAVCKEKFSLAMHLKSHIKKQNHDTSSTCYQCGNCGVIFTSLLSLSRHARIHSASAPQFDPDDDSQKVTVDSKDILLSNKKRKRTYCCRQCRKLFSTLKKLTTHRLMTHGKSVNFNCEQCSATFMYKNQLVEHLRTHSGEKPFPCSICGMCFARQSYVAIHERVHTGEKRYKCKECNKAYAHRNPLIAHERTHVGDAPFKCTLCPKSYTSKTSLTLHEKTRHKETQESFQCTLCGKMFSDKRNLRRHETYHYGTRPFPCTICPNSFLFKKDLNDHMNIHTGEKPYQCSQCGSTFRQLSAVKIHEKLHTGIKSFQCNICSKYFTRKASLDMHVVRHSGKRQHGCELCDKAFFNKDDLNKHKLVHTGEKKFQCEQCGRSFAKSWNWKVHVKTAHGGEKLHWCQCGKSFMRSKALNEHTKICTKTNIAIIVDEPMLQPHPGFLNQY